MEWNKMKWKKFLFLYVYCGGVGGGGGGGVVILVTDDPIQWMIEWMNEWKTIKNMSR